MRQPAAIVFLAMCASGLVVAASWDLPGFGPGPAPGPVAHRAAPAPAGGIQAQAAPRDVELTVSFQGEPVAGGDLHASVSAPDGAGIVSWALDDAPPWLRLTQDGTSAVLSGTVPPDAAGLSFTVAATDGDGRTFYAGSGDTPLAGPAGTVNAGDAIGSAMALPTPAAPPSR